jgi:hypothetical protein
MCSKTPVLLLVLVETVRLRWFVASLGLDGRAALVLTSRSSPIPNPTKKCM